jgi:hypothetical protein
VAQQVTVKLVDDMDGSEASETIAFALEGRSYEIDLSKDNKARLEDALSPYLKAARRNSGRSNAARKPRASSPAAEHRAHTTDIRKWARGAGHKISDRGRIPASVIEAFQARK